MKDHYPLISVSELSTVEIEASTFEVLWTQHLWDRVEGQTWLIAFQNPNGPVVSYGY